MGKLIQCFIMISICLIQGNILPPLIVGSHLYFAVGINLVPPAINYKKYRVNLLGINYLWINQYHLELWHIERYQSDDMRVPIVHLHHIFYCHCSFNHELRGNAC